MIQYGHMILLAALVAATSGIAADWPAFRGPNADGISPETGLNRAWKDKPPRVLWTVRLNAPSYAGPSVAAGRLFILDHKGDREILRALDLATGKERWRYAYADTATDLYGYARSTPLIEGGRVYTLSRLGLVHCLDAKTGQCLWSRDLVKEFGTQRPRWDYSMSPLIDGDKLILCPGGTNGVMAALEKATGRTIWQGGGNAMPVYATPVTAVIGGQRQYVLLTDGQVLGLRAADGQRLWSYPYEAHQGMNAATPLVMGEELLVTASGGPGDAVLSIGAEGAKEKWKGQELQSRFSTPILYEGHVYSTSDKGHLVCLDPTTGKAKWKQPGFEWGGAVAFEGHLVVANGQQGDLVLVRMNPSAYDERGRIRPLGGQTWTAPILADGKLIVRNKTALACVDLR
jgi:outer membrane protein assembly factor BamB